MNQDRPLCFINVLLSPDTVDVPGCLHDRSFPRSVHRLPSQLLLDLSARRRMVTVGRAVGSCTNGIRWVLPRSDKLWTGATFSDIHPPQFLSMTFLDQPAGWAVPGVDLRDQSGGEDRQANGQERENDTPLHFICMTSTPPIASDGDPPPPGPSRPVPLCRCPVPPRGEPGPIAAKMLPREPFAAVGSMQMSDSARRSRFHS